METEPPLERAEAFRPWHTPSPREDCCPARRPILRALDVTVSYGGTTALRNVSLGINRGCITAIVGPSGCGKSTFLMSLNRMTDLVGSASVIGDIRLDEQPVLGDAVDLLALRRRVGLIAQRPNPFPLSIRRNMTFPLREHGVSDRARQTEIMEECLHRVGLWAEVRDRLDRPALGLSGGQQQRLCLARALALEPEVLLLDEPCSALDPMASAIIEGLIEELRGRYTIVIVTHNLAQARRIADDMALFWATDGVGTLVEAGTAEQLFTRPCEALTRAYVSGMRG